MAFGIIWGHILTGRVKIVCVNKLKKHYVVIGLVIILALIAGAFVVFNKKMGLPFFRFNRDNNFLETTRLKEQNSNQTAPEEKTIQNQVEIPQNLPEGVSTENLKPVEGKNGSGTFYAVSEGGNFSLAIETKLPDAEPKDNYFAWLSKEAALGSNANILKLGKLGKNQDAYFLNFYQSGNFPKYNFFTVTLEKTDDESPETKILQSSF